VLWLLIALVVVLLCLAVLAVNALSLWRATKRLARQLSAAGEAVDQVSGALDGARAAGPLGAGPCPTCGAPPRSVGSRPSAVASRAR
jgi:type II secretory pathway pseudopilin PulG